MHFISSKFSNPRRAKMPAAFAEVFQMILEIFTVLFVVHCVRIVSRMIGRRDDVLYYVSKSSSPVSKG
jgi:hypothetical protein